MTYQTYEKTFGINDLIQVYTTNDVGTTTGTNLFDNTTDWIPWKKPTMAKLIHFILIGAGGGGGQGGTNIAANTTGGGGGGGAGGLTNILMPAFCVPDMLYLKLGLRGKFATTTNGGNTLACFSNSNTPIYANMLLGSAGGANGGGGSTGAGSGGLGGGNISSFIKHGVRNYNSGQSGGNGQAGGTTADVATLTPYTTNVVIPGGAGGGGTNNTGASFAGGQMSTYENTYTSSFPGVSGGGNGSHGTQSGNNLNNFVDMLTMGLSMSGGSGGGGNTTGNGGRGGDGGIGCGGGGGGGVCSTGTSGGVAGAGGLGGGGFISIITYM